MTVCWWQPWPEPREKIGQDHKASQQTRAFSFYPFASGVEIFGEIFYSIYNMPHICVCLYTTHFSFSRIPTALRLNAVLVSIISKNLFNLASSPPIWVHLNNFPELFKRRKAGNWGCEASCVVCGGPAGPVWVVFYSTFILFSWIMKLEHRWTQFHCSSCCGHGHDSMGDPFKRDRGYLSSASSSTEFIFFRGYSSHLLENMPPRPFDGQNGGHQLCFTVKK